MLIWDDEESKPAANSASVNKVIVIGERLARTRELFEQEVFDPVPQLMRRTELARVLCHYYDTIVDQTGTLAMVLPQFVISDAKLFREALDSFLGKFGVELLSAQLELDSRVLIDRTEEVRAARKVGHLQLATENGRAVAASGSSSGATTPQPEPAVAAARVSEMAASAAKTARLMFELKHATPAQFRAVTLAEAAELMDLNALTHFSRAMIEREAATGRSGLSRHFPELFKNLLVLTDDQHRVTGVAAG